MSTLRSVSCPSAAFCVAVDPVGNVFTYDGAPITSVLVTSNGTTLSGTTATLDTSASNAASVGFLLFDGSYGHEARALCRATLTYYGWVCSWNHDGSYILVSETFNSAGSTFSGGVGITIDN
jgi:hypothetical protein